MIQKKQQSKKQRCKSKMNTRKIKPQKVLRFKKQSSHNQTINRHVNRFSVERINRNQQLQSGFMRAHLKTAHKKLLFEKKEENKEVNNIKKKKKEEAALMRQKYTQEYLNRLPFYYQRVNRADYSSQEKFLKESQIDLLREVQNIGQQKACQICLSEIEHHDKEIYLFCFHSFHSQCVKDWLRYNGICPVCKFDVKDYIKQL